MYLKCTRFGSISASQECQSIKYISSTVLEMYSIFTRVSYWHTWIIDNLHKVRPWCGCHGCPLWHFCVVLYQGRLYGLCVYSTLHINLCCCRLTFPRDGWQNSAHGIQNRWKCSTFSTRVELVCDVVCYSLEIVKRVTITSHFGEISIFFNNHPTR